MPIIEATGLVQSFGKEKILNGVDLTVEEGEIFGLIGPSGAGKSTLIRSLTGYLEPSGGEVKVFDLPPTSFGAAERRRIGFMPQDFVLYDGLSVRRNLAFVASLYGLRFTERRRRIREALEFVELWADRRKMAASISGGMRRRLQLAATIVHEPRLLFIDEPTASLDPVLRRKFWEEFKTLRYQGRTIFVTTQYVGEAELCDRVGFLLGGKLLAVGTPDELRKQAFGGEIVEISLGGDPGSLVEPLSSLADIGHVLEIREGTSAGNPVSEVHLVVEDADVALPAIFDTLKDADVRSADISNPSFDEVFFRLVHGDR